ncbi:TerD family protein [Rhodococcus sp. (in: high G+C Gram-positive bacteria)]|uniref:TerD family protein n=1 Tax=Rhodococcus sp. TaxID=1831 RepID=UPI003B8A5EB9
MNLPPGAMLSLTKCSPGLTAVTVEIGWTLSSPASYDVDAFAIALSSNGKMPTVSDFVYYSNRTSPGDAITLTTNELGESGEIHIFALDLTAVSTEIATIVFPAAIYDAQCREQSFDHVRDVFIRILRQDDSTELARCELPNSATAAAHTAVLLGDLHRRAGEWLFRPLGRAFPGGSEGILRHYGLDVAGNA